MSLPLQVVVLRFPSIGEQQELDALFADERAVTRWIVSAAEMGSPDIIVLPGSEQTLADLAWMRATGLFDGLLAEHRRGALIVGICGGFQIMGTLLKDPLRLEGGELEATGLALLPVETTFARDAIEEPTIGTSTGAFLPEGALVHGREIHGGRSVLTGEAISLFGEATKGGGGCPLGVATADLGVIGTYLHDVLVDPAFLGKLFERARETRRRAG